MPIYKIVFYDYQGGVLYICSNLSIYLSVYKQYYVKTTVQIFQKILDIIQQMAPLTCAFIIISTYLHFQTLSQRPGSRSREGQKQNFDHNISYNENT